MNVGVYFSRCLMFTGMLGLLLGSVSAQDADRLSEYVRQGNDLREAFQEVVAEVSRSVVVVTCDNRTRAIGFVVDPDGLVITKASMLRGELGCRFKNNKLIRATEVARDEKTDLALLRLPLKGLVPVDWGQKKDLGVGSWVISAGRGSRPVAVGVVSIPPRVVPAASGFLGVQIDTEKDGGVRITQVVSDTAAERAGLQVDDVVLEVEGKPVKSREGFVKNIGSRTEGDEVRISIRRGAERQVLKIRLGQRSDGDGRPWRRRSSARRSNFPKVLQHDSIMTPAQCGGPLVDVSGNIIGINIARSGRTASLALTVDVARTSIKRLMARAGR